MRPVLKYSLSVLLPLTIAIAACSGSGPSPKRTASLQSERVAVDGGSYTNVDPAGLLAMLKTKDLLLINVHIPYEGEIEGTDLFIPYNDIEAHLGELPEGKGSKLVLYCRSGNMSDTASRTLVRLGYTNIWNLDGGMIAWEASGFPLLHKAR
jgi:rhodanese-related sulfurtransferase